jgi:ABC-type branched-subunit amino acid transport system substrate-binding protein
VAEDIVPPDTKDFTAVILKLKQADPDVVYVEAFPGFEIPFMKQAYELGLKPRQFFNAWCELTTISSTEGASGL